MKVEAKQAGGSHDHERNKTGLRLATALSVASWRAGVRLPAASYSRISANLKAAKSNSPQSFIEHRVQERSCIAPCPSLATFPDPQLARYFCRVSKVVDANDVLVRFIRAAPNVRFSLFQSEQTCRCRQRPTGFSTELLQ